MVWVRVVGRRCSVCRGVALVVVQVSGRRFLVWMRVIVARDRRLVNAAVVSGVVRMIRLMRVPSVGRWGPLTWRRRRPEGWEVPMRRRGRRRVVPVTRVSPTAARRWAGSSVRARSGVGYGLRRSEERMARASRDWRTARICGRRRGRKHVVLVMPVSPTPASRWRTSSERASLGARRALRR